MGRELVRAVHATPGCTLVGGTEPKGSPAIGEDLGSLAGVGALGVRITGDPLELVTRTDAILDFTVPSASVEHAGLAANARIIHVLGTTGLSEADEKAIAAAARHATACPMRPRPTMPMVFPITRGKDRRCQSSFRTLLSNCGKPRATAISMAMVCSATE